MPPAAGRVNKRGDFGQRFSPKFFREVAQQSGDHFPSETALVGRIQHALIVRTEFRLARDSFDSFIKYQRRMQRLFDGMRKRYDFQAINGNRSVRAIQKELRQQIEEVVSLPDSRAP